MTVQATFAATLVDEWVRSGVAHAVVSPGSRSTSLAVALADDGRLAVHVHLDERSAGFMALGVGVATGVPAVVLTTSGTAAAELHPAVVEAGAARVPMVVCTADRPPELQQVGAPQTIDQVRLYGGSVRWYGEPGVADATTASTWRSLASRAVAEATGAVPGPVHLNLAFRDPLVGRPGPKPEGRPDGRPWHRVLVPAVPAPAAVQEIAGLISGRRGVVVAGAGSGHHAAVHALASTLGWPLLADPRAPARAPGPAVVVGAADALLRDDDFAKSVAPEVVLRLGQAPASKVVGTWAAAGADVIRVGIEASGAWLDPDRSLDVVAGGDVSTWCRALAACVVGTDAGWAARWTQAEGVAQEAIEATLAAEPGMTEPAVARRLAEAMPDGSTLVASSSMPVRDLEWYARPRPGLSVVANRGANGIDGVVSTAVGVALAGGRAAALIGDLAFLHDSNGLLGLANRRVELTLVVVDNRGGGIFSFLPQAGALAPERFDQLLATPQDVDLPTLVAAHGLAVITVHSPEAIGPALAAAMGVAGPTVVVVRTDRVGNVAAHDRIHAAVAEALSIVR